MSLAFLVDVKIQFQGREGGGGFALPACCVSLSISDHQTYTNCYVMMITPLLASYSIVFFFFVDYSPVVFFLFFEVPHTLLLCLLVLVVVNDTLHTTPYICHDVMSGLDCRLQASPGHQRTGRAPLPHTQARIPPKAAVRASADREPPGSRYGRAHERRGMACRIHIPTWKYHEASRCCCGCMTPSPR